MSVNKPLTRVQTYWKANSMAIKFNGRADSDYIAARCCIINGLLSQGFVLAEQAIEKKLKSLLLLLNPLENVKQYRNHQIEPLIKRIQILSDLGLNNYLTFGKKISDLFTLNRYPDHGLPICTYGMSSLELATFDEMYFYLMEISPLIDEIKYRISLYSWICIENNDITSRYWATIQNKTYEAKKNEIQERFIEVYKINSLS